MCKPFTPEMEQILQQMTVEMDANRLLALNQRLLDLFEQRDKEQKEKGTKVKP